MVQKFMVPITKMAFSADMSFFTLKVILSEYAQL